MHIHLRQGIALIYLLAVLVLGGASSAGLIGNLALQIGGAALIGLTLWSEDPQEGTPTGLRTFLVALALVVLVQFVPLPPVLWEALPGRGSVAEGFELAGIAKPWLTLSLDPWATLQSATWWLPAIAVLVLFRAKHAPETRHIVWLVGAIAYISIIVATLQVSFGSNYFYAVTNRGNGVGFFANSNHLTSFLIVASALIAGQWMHERPAQKLYTQQRSILVLVGLLAPLLAGIGLTSSLSGQVLIVPVLLGLFLIARPELSINWYAVGGLIAIFGVGMVWLLNSGLASNDLMAKSGTPGISRGEFLATGSAIFRDFAPIGSGLGTFSDIYPWYEDATKIGTTYVNHVHNDLLELTIETGLFGLALLGLFLRWFFEAAWQLWNQNRADNAVALSATLGIGAVLIHSLVDYPLRTAAVSSLIALCCVLMKRPAAPSRPQFDTASGEGKRESMMEI